MKHLTDSIQTVCQSIVNKNQQYKVEIPNRPLSFGKANKALIDTISFKSFRDHDHHVMINTYRSQPKLMDFSEITQDALNILTKYKQVVDGTYGQLIALLQHDVYIQGYGDIGQNPIRDNLSYSTRDVANGIYVKNDHGFIDRSKPHGKGDTMGYLTLATEKELKKVLTILTNML